MNTIFRVIGILLVVGVFVSSQDSAAQDNAAEEKRICTATDLVGSWKMVQQRGKDVDTTDPWFYEHQRYIFYKDGSVRHMSSTQPITKDAELMEIGPATSRYVVNKGWLTITAAQVPDTGACGIMVTDGAEDSGVQKGDLLLYYMENDEVVLTRHWKKLK